MGSRIKLSNWMSFSTDGPQDPLRASSPGLRDDLPGPKKHGASAGRCQGMRLAFDPTPMVSHMTLPPFWGRVECEKVAFLAAKRGSRR